jgi:ADP-L-glycero-D-manno-heptose 6-epimerase
MSQSIIVITGAAGMIGSCTVRYLNDQGMVDLLLVDDLERSDKWKNLLGKQFIDLISKHHLFEWLKQHQDEVDAVIHLGACSDTTESNADYLMENNFRYTVQLAKWAVTHGKRFIYASSAATYGDGRLGFTDCDEKILDLRPLNMYGFSKQLADLWMKREKVLNQVVGLKYFNVFGPNEYHKGEMASMILKMCEKVNRKGKIQLFKSNDPNYGHGEQCRDFIYVKDAVRMTCAFLRPKYRNANGLFNIGQGKPTTWNQLSGALFKALGKEPNFEYIEMPKILSSQYQNYTCADMRKFNTVFSSDLQSPTSIDEAVGEYVQEYLMRNARW